ncbi:hypothetical protein [Acinetobacter sp. ANC 4648]|uniref:hypothetical protein n=1 Tax=Acinetobacter sp. ANC 4648 TaxID=1977875 RepID=UPI0011780B3E|nr:hypothetical protein [Acinetobacter sp. ANC 4648]
MIKIILLLGLVAVSLTGCVSSPYDNYSNGYDYGSYGGYNLYDFGGYDRGHYQPDWHNHENRSSQSEDRDHDRSSHDGDRSDGDGNRSGGGHYDGSGAHSGGSYSGRGEGNSDGERGR